MCMYECICNTLPVVKNIQPAVVAAVEAFDLCHSLEAANLIRLYPAFLIKVIAHNVELVKMM